MSMFYLLTLTYSNIYTVYVYMKKQYKNRYQDV